MPRLERYTHAARPGAQGFERHRAGLEHVAERGIDVSLPEVLAQAQPRRQGKDQLDVGSRLAAGSDNWPAQLHQRPRLSVDLEPDSEPASAQVGRVSVYGDRLDPAQPCP